MLKQVVPLKHDTKFLVLLPRNSYFTILLLDNLHCLVLHNCTTGVLPELSMYFWICSEIKSVKNVFKIFTFVN